MALTNYLAQSLISTSVFYGYGAGQWGLARSWQVVYVAAVFARDYPLVMAVTLFVAVLVIVSNILADVCYALLDPRIALK